MNSSKIRTALTRVTNAVKFHLTDVLERVAEPRPHARMQGPNPKKPTQKLVIDYGKVLKTDISFLYKYYKKIGHIKTAVERDSLPLMEHYKLLTYISFQFNNATIFDLGTHNGLSALCLAQNPKNKVVTYDIALPGEVSSGTKEIFLPEFQDQHLPYLKDYPNIESRIKDINEEDDAIILGADLIMLDVSHNGRDERKFSRKLERMDYKGYIFCDDVFTEIFPLRDWFQSIPVVKYDLTEIGHSTGTGLLNYYNDDSVTIVN